MSNCNWVVPPLPRGWTETECPKGHPAEGNRKVVGKKKPLWACRTCVQETITKNQAVRAKGDEPRVAKVPLVCGHTVLYRKGYYRPGDEPLWCARHEDWVAQGIAA